MADKTYNSALHFPESVLQSDSNADSEELSSSQCFLHSPAARLPELHPETKWACDSWGVDGPAAEHPAEQNTSPGFINGERRLVLSIKIQPINWRSFC